jgi:hypothetical protein
LSYLPSHEERPEYDVAEICQNGHVTNESTKAYPAFSKTFCDICGSRTTTACDCCCQSIRGRMRGSLSASAISAPPFCQYCGTAFPWTASKLEAARELVDELGLNIPEKSLLNESIDDLVRDTPKAQAAAVRFSRLTERAKPVVKEGFKTLLVEVVSESVKKLMWP